MTESSQASQEISITIRNDPTAVTKSSLDRLLNTLGYGADNSKVYLPIDCFRHRSKGFTVANFEKKQGAFQELQGLIKKQGAFQELQGFIKKQGAFQQDAVQEQMSATEITSMAEPPLVHSVNYGNDEAEPPLVHSVNYGYEEAQQLPAPAFSMIRRRCELFHMVVY